jgi:tetratricopeptide (TPR) repeat protein
MRLHYLRGDFSAAIAAFESFERRLKDELGARPSAETIELLATIEASATRLPVRRAVVPASLMRPPRLVGRADELAGLARAWGERRIFALHGEPGIGKTRLLQEFVAGQAGIVVVQSRPGDAGIAYAVLARLLRAVLAQHDLALGEGQRRELALVLPELGPAEALTGEAQRLLLHRVVEATLVAAAGRGLRAVIVDDLHFADDASVDLLQSLTQADGLSALAWGFAQRRAESGVAVKAFHSGLEETQHLSVISLGPLDAAQMTELVESLALPEVDAAALALALLRHTGGNPMFALETLKDMLLSGVRGSADRLPQPTSVGALVERRLTQLSAPALKLARTAALAGADFTAELAATVLEVHPLDIAEPWRELEAAQVIRDGAFAHDLIFEVTRASVPEPIARLLHRRIAAYLRDRGAQPANVAPHWAGAHEWSLAGEAHAAAARLAQSASQRGHEVEHWQRARDCFDRAGAAERSFEVRCESVQAVIVVNGVARADALIDSLVAEAASDRQRVAALTARAMAALMAADHRAGIAAAKQAAERARALDAPWQLFEAERLHAVGLAQSGCAVEGLAVIEPFRERVEQEGSVEQKGRFWADYAYVLNGAGRLRDTAEALRRATENAQALGDLSELATLTSNLATVQGNLGHVDQALVLAERALAIQVQLGTTDGPGGGVVETYVGLYCTMAGRYREALERFDAAIARFRRDGQKLWVAVASNHLAQCLLELGQFARARQALDYDAPPVDWVRTRGATIAARIDRALGPSDDAVRGRILALVDGAGEFKVRMHAMLDQTALLEPRAALARCDDVVRQASELEFIGVVARARLLRAASLHRAGAGGAAALELRALLPSLATVQPADMYLPEAWWIAVQVFDACGASDDAAMALAQGTRWIRQTALPHVPDSFQESFLNRNPVNRALLAAARR